MNRSWNRRQWHHIMRNHRVAQAKRKGTFIRFSHKAAALSRMMGATINLQGRALLDLIHNEESGKLPDKLAADAKMDRIGTTWKA